MDDDRNQPPEVDGELTQHPYVSRRRPDPAAPAEPVLVLDGMLGDSDRPGHRRLYFTLDLDTFAEFRDEDVLRVDSIAAETPPLVGEEASRVTLRRDAVVHYTQTRQLRPVDEFDLDVRLSTRRRPGSFQRLPPDTGGCETAGCFTYACTAGCSDVCGTDDCPTQGDCTGVTDCRPRTCNTCNSAWC